MISRHSNTGFQNKANTHNELCVFLYLCLTTNLLLHLAFHFSIHCCLNFEHWNPKSVMEDHKEKVTVSDPTQMKIDVLPEPFEQNVDVHAPGTSGGATGFLRQWKKKDMLIRGSLGLRGIALFFSLISFMLMASNKHGDWKEFDKYQEYRYLLAVAILSSLYSGVQVFRQVRELSTGKNTIQQRTAGLIDFVGDQVVAYLLLSSTSSAIPITDRIRESADNNMFTDSSAAAIAFSFFAFCCLALSAVISGYKLSTQTYI